MGNYEQALKEAFIGFDATLLEAKVIEELKQMARKNPDYEDSDMDDDDETAEDIVNLHHEAKMPLSEVLEKYKDNADALAKIQSVQRLMGLANKQKDEAEASPGPSSSKVGGSGSSTSPKPSGSGNSPKKSASDNEVSSSSSKALLENEADTAEPSSSSSAPDSTHTIPQPTEGEKPEQSTTTTEANGEVAGSDSKMPSDEAISSSQENGESASSCPSSSSAQPLNYSMGGSSAAAAAGAPTPSKAPKVPNHISSSSLPDTETDSSSDDENDETYKESGGAPKPVNSDGDTTEEEVDGEEDEELDEEEEESGEEDEDESFDDEFMNNMETGPGKASGCTAVVALLSGRDLFVANAGDSRAVVCRDGKVVEMSYDHKPEDDLELARIRKAGGRVTLDGRVNGGLNLSRAIGDHGYKANKELPAEEQMISALPDLKRVTIEPNDEFMVLACDGIWNYMSNEEVVGYVKQRIDAGKLTLAEICEEVS